MSKYTGPFSDYNDRKDDPTYSIELFLIDDGPSFTVLESWGTPPNRFANIFRYGPQFPPGEYTQLTLPTQLIPKIVDKISDPHAKADFLACIGGGSKTAATAEGNAS